MSNDNEATKAAAGAAVGGTVAIGAVTAAGPVAGLGATGITSGLAALGSVVGGGMATGLVITAAIPVACAAAAFGLYKWRKS
jgi:choline-glycine betaine transporter